MPVFKVAYFNLVTAGRTAKGHLKTALRREVAWLPIGGSVAADERAVRSRPPADGV